MENKNKFNEIDNENKSSKPNDNYVMVDVRQNEESNPDENTKVIEIVTKTSYFKYFLGAMIIFAVCFISCFFTFNIALTQVGVVGYSMQPTINTSAIYNNSQWTKTDMVYCYKTNNIKNKDIVIIEAGKTQSNEMLIKRVVATPGQTIIFRKTGDKFFQGANYFTYKVYIKNKDGVEKELVENYINKEEALLVTRTTAYPYYNTLIKALRNNSEYIQKLEKNQYYVMGDNRNNSTDSRFFGPISQDEILWKVAIHVKYGQSMFSAVWSAMFWCKTINC